jgi:hypothetical protein
MINQKLIGEFENIILSTLFADDSSATQPYYEKFTGMLKGDFNYFLKDKPDRQISNFVCCDPTNERLYADSPDLLVKPIHKVIGESSEFVLNNRNDADTIWVRYERVNQAPKRISVHGKFRFGYIIHRKHSYNNNSGFYYKEFIGFDHNGTPLTSSAKGSGSLCLTQSNYDTLIGLCSVKEDLYRENAIRTKITHAGKSASFPLPIDFYKNEFLIRKAPLTPTGRRKPILHTVSEHIRKNKTKVDGFSRGIETFFIDDFKVELELNRKCYLDLAV